MGLHGSQNGEKGKEWNEGMWCVVVTCKERCSECGVSFEEMVRGVNECLGHLGKEVNH